MIAGKSEWLNVYPTSDVFFNTRRPTLIPNAIHIPSLYISLSFHIEAKYLISNVNHVISLLAKQIIILHFFNIALMFVGRILQRLLNKMTSYHIIFLILLFKFIINKIFQLKMSISINWQINWLIINFNVG